MKKQKVSSFVVTFIYYLGIKHGNQQRHLNNHYCGTYYHLAKNSSWTLINTIIWAFLSHFWAVFGIIWVILAHFFHVGQNIIHIGYVCDRAKNP